MFKEVLTDLTDRDCDTYFNYISANYRLIFVREIQFLRNSLTVLVSNELFV